MSAEEKIKILLVDDQPRNLLPLEAILESPDYHLVKTHSGKEALKQLLKEDFAVILLDVKMPELDGFETAKLIKKRDRSKHIPIIFLTAVSQDAEQIFKGYSVGAVDYVLKPFNPDILKSKVSVFANLYRKSLQLLREQRARAEAEAARNYLSFLVDASSLLASSLDYKTTLSQVARFAVPRLADWCAVDILGEDRSIQRIAAAHDPPANAPADAPLHRYPPDLKTGREVAQALGRGEPALYPDLEESLAEGEDADPERLKWVRELGLISMMIVPLVARGRILGAISFFTAESGRRYGTDDLLFAKDLAQRAALAIDNARLYSDAQQELAERKQMEQDLLQKSLEAEESNRLKSQFVSNVSHELRTPINAIIGYSALLLDGTYGGVVPEQREPLEGVVRNAKELLNLVNDVLDLSRIEAGKLSIQFERIALSPMLREIMEGLRPLTRSKLKVRWKKVDDLPPIVSDATKIKQIFTNLLSNAVKFTEEGSVTIKGRNLPEKERIEISVEDTGIGIRPEELPKLFTAFHQIDADLTRAYGGVGLGLKIVKDLIQLLAGEIRVESRYGEGSTFTVSLPYRFDRRKTKRA